MLDISEFYPESEEARSNLLLAELVYRFAMGVSSRGLTPLQASPGRNFQPASTRLTTGPMHSPYNSQGSVLSGGSNHSALINNHNNYNAFTLSINQLDENIQDSFEKPNTSSSLSSMMSRNSDFSHGSGQYTGMANASPFATPLKGIAVDVLNRGESFHSNGSSFSNGGYDPNYGYNISDKSTEENVVQRSPLQRTGSQSFYGYPSGSTPGSTPTGSKGRYSSSAPNLNGYVSSISQSSSPRGAPRNGNNISSNLQMAPGLVSNHASPRHNYPNQYPLQLQRTSSQRSLKHTVSDLHTFDEEIDLSYTMNVVNSSSDSNQQVNMSSILIGKGSSFTDTFNATGTSPPPPTPYMLQDRTKASVTVDPMSTATSSSNNSSTNSLGPSLVNSASILHGDNIWN